MDNNSTAFLDETWISRLVPLSSGNRLVRVKRCPTFKDAKAIREEYGDGCHQGGHALFIGESPLPNAVKNWEELAEASPEEPWYMELVFVRSTNFEEVLNFIDLYAFGIDSVRSSPRLQSEGRELLRWIWAAGPFRFTQINGLVVSGKFVCALPNEVIDQVLERVHEFNSRYFTVELSAQSWKRNLLKSKSFDLGPC